MSIQSADNILIPQNTRAVGNIARSPLPQIQGPVPVIVTDFQMSIGSMIVFMIKWAVAAIPAFVILATVGAFALLLMAAVGNALK
jgi:hypothetical protein